MARKVLFTTVLAALFVGYAPIAANTQTVSAPATPEIAAAPTNCGNRNDIVQKLNQEFKENPAAVGVVDRDAVLEIFVSDNGTWTIIATGTDGNSCVLSAGEAWESTTFVKGKDA
jgi:hypothetical protein